jgi:CHAT domain-containing protein
MDLMQQAELDDFFGEACLTVHSVQVEAVDPQAAVVYAIVLATNLEVIVSIPHQPLQHFRIGINAETLATVAEQFRQGLVIRSRRLFLQPGQQLYNWLIRPSLDTLEAQGIETLVFVLDGPLRNLPMAALHDGQKFLVEQYGVAMTPSVNLLAPQPLSDRGIKTLAAGLTQARDGFPPLTFVGQELDVIEAQVPGLFLRDQAFTRENLQHKLLNHSFSLVHIATHGQFSSEEAETFLLTWDGRLSIRQLGAMIQSQSVRQRPIELLILSACETAAGNHQAALGLAGMAVRAGARSTLASLWAVSDESTAVLMGSFYQNLGQAKMAKAQALRQAQIELIRNPRYQHPFYWSAFVLMGNWL